MVPVKNVVFRWEKTILLFQDLNKFTLASSLNWEKNNIKNKLNKKGNFEYLPKKFFIFPYTLKVRKKTICVKKILS